MPTLYPNQHPNFYIPEQHMENQRSLQMAAYEYYKTEREIEITERKQLSKEKVKLWAMQERQKIKSENSEARRSIYEEVMITEDGRLEIQTRNLQISAVARELSNIKNPKLTVLKREQNQAEELYLIKCNVAGEDKEIYLSPSKIRGGTYLLNKFALAGASINAPTNKAKEYARQLLRLLIVKSNETIILPEKAGWMVLPDNTVHLVEKEDLLWTDAMKLAL